MTEPRWPRFAAAGLGFLWFLQIGGAHTLNPLNTAWLFWGDWRQHWLGFLFFQHEPWTIPLGKLSSLLYPVGTNIGYTDSNPLLAILVKPLSGVLPAEFQLIGPWLALCFMLQGYMGAALASAVTKDAGQQVLGGYLIVLSPVLVTRLGHDTLCAHWILLALLYLGLREYEDDRIARRSALWAVGAVLLAGAIHPYLAAMSWVLALAVFVRLWRARRLSLTFAGAAVAFATAGLITEWAAIGYFGKATDGSGGFDVYASHLLTLVDPRDTASRVLPALPSVPGEWEGFGFLGLGGIVALVTATAVLMRHRPARRPGIWAPITACLVLGIYALSSRVRVANHDILNLGWLYEPLMPLIRPFRSSGRFIWPLHYLLLTFGVWGATRAPGSARRQLGTVVLAIAVTLQAADINTDNVWPKPVKGSQVSLTPFQPLPSQYRHLALAPMQVMGVCTDPYQEDHVYRFMLLARRLNLTFNSGIFARLNVKDVRAACDAQNRDVDAGTFDPQTIYVVSPDELPRFQAHADAACGRWDGNWICVSRSGNPRFATYIVTGKDPGVPGSQ